MISGFTRIDIELAFSTIVIAVLTFVAYRAGHRLRIRSQQIENIALVASVSIAFWLAWNYFGRLVWAETITSSSVLCWSNVTPVALGLAGGMIGHARGLRQRFRPRIAVCVMSLAVLYAATPIARPIVFPLRIESGVKWKNGVCLQSHSASCAPAAAVTLLKQHGINASEARLSNVCLSSSLGTAPLGLYRGLKNVAGEHDHRAIVASGDPDQWIVTGQLPCVALVTFESIPGQALGNRLLGNRLLGNRFSGHVITVFGRTENGDWSIGDPAVGKLTWSNEELRQRFTGEAIYLSPLRNRIR